MRKWNRFQTARHNSKVLAAYQGGQLYYVMRPNIVECGLATTIRCVLSHAKYAEEHGVTLIMDYKNRKNPYLRDDEVGKVNAWDYFFEQPCGVALESAEGCENVFLTEENQLPISPTDSVEFYTNDACVAYWRNIYRKYIRLSENAAQFIENQRREVFGANGEHSGKSRGRVLGCIVRGTDYIQGRPLNHPVQPLPEDVVQKAKEVMAEQGYEKLFLATEDANVLELFRKEFGDRLLYVQQQRYRDGKTPLALQEGYAAESDPKTEGLKYLSVIYLLAGCDGLIGGRCGITTIAYLISDGFEYEYLWNLGRYQTDDYCLPERYK
jgi:hypothetical protein